MTCTTCRCWVATIGDQCESCYDDEALTSQRWAAARAETERLQAERAERLVTSGALS